MTKNITLSDEVIAERKALYELGSKNINPKDSGVYCWTNLVTGKKYVGLGVDLYRRHLAFLCYGSHYAGKKIDRARAKYNDEKYWSYEVLEYCDNPIEREQYWIKLYDTVNNGYNITYGGEQPYVKYATQEEQRGANNARRRVANMTQEQHEARKAHDRERYANMTPEQREKKNARHRERYANMTPEQRERRNAYFREYMRANETLERHERRNAYFREYMRARYAAKKAERLALQNVD